MNKTQELKVRLPHPAAPNRSANRVATTAAGQRAVNRAGPPRQLKSTPSLSQEDPGQKIWDKKTASCRQKLKRFDKFQTAIDERYVPINSFNQKEKKVIEVVLG